MSDFGKKDPICWYWCILTLEKWAKLVAILTCKLFGPKTLVVYIFDKFHVCCKTVDMVDFLPRKSKSRLSNFSFPAFSCHETLQGTRNLFCISSGWFQSKQSVFYRAVNYMLNSKCVSFIGNWHQTCEYWIYHSPSFRTFKTSPSNQLLIFVNHDFINLKMTSTLRSHILC